MVSISQKEIDRLCNTRDKFTDPANVENLGDLYLLCKTFTNQFERVCRTRKVKAGSVIINTTGRQIAFRKSE